MPRSLVSVLLFFIAMHCQGQTAEKAVHTLEVRVQGIRQAGKKVYIALYSKADKFPSDSSSFRNTGITAGSSEGIARLDVPYGEYAIAVFVDVNGNGKLDKNIFGFPKEQFGFSNDFRPRTSAPKFENCSFVFSEQKRQVTITLRK